MDVSKEILPRGAHHKKKNLRKDFGQKEKEIIPDGKSEIQKKLGKKE